MSSVMTLSYDQTNANEFAQFIKGLGFRVFLAEKGNYGIIADPNGQRVMSFQFDGLGQSLSGNYGPPSRESGTGWRLDVTPVQLKTREDVERALNSYPPDFCGKGWKRFTTLEQHLADYGSSSRYRELL